MSNYLPTFRDEYGVALTDDEYQAKKTQESYIAASTKDQFLLDLRQIRDSLLSETDYLLMPDYSINNIVDIKTYRQALRDLPDTLSADIVDVKDVVWPIKPKVDTQ